MGPRFACAVAKKVSEHAGLVLGEGDMGNATGAQSEPALTVFQFLNEMQILGARLIPHPKFASCLQTVCARSTPIFRIIVRHARSTGARS